MTMDKETEDSSEVLLSSSISDRKGLSDDKWGNTNKGQWIYRSPELKII